MFRGCSPPAAGGDHRARRTGVSEARSSLGSARRSAVVELQAGAAGRPVLHLVHDEDGSLECFQALVDALGPEQPVCGIEPPLEADGSVAFSAADRLALRYVADLQRRQVQGPYHLLGVGPGGIVAFEMARLLRREGQVVALAGVVDCGPGRLPGPDRVLRRRPAWVDAVESRRPGVPPEQRRRRRTRRSLAALTGTRWRPRPFDGDLHVFWSRGVASTGPSLGWAPFVRSVTVVDLPVDHTQVLDRAHVHHLAGPLRDLLSRRRRGRFDRDGGSA